MKGGGKDKGKGKSWAHLGAKPLVEFQEGDIVTGTVTNINPKYGIFVDFGAEKDGLLQDNSGHQYSKGDFLTGLCIVNIKYDSQRVTLRQEVRQRLDRGGADWSKFGEMQAQRQETGEALPPVDVDRFNRKGGKGNSGYSSGADQWSGGAWKGDGWNSDDKWAWNSRKWDSWSQEDWQDDVQQDAWNDEAWGTCESWSGGTELRNGNKHAPLWNDGLDEVDGGKGSKGKHKRSLESAEWMDRRTSGTNSSRSKSKGKGDTTDVDADAHTGDESFTRAELKVSIFWMCDEDHDGLLNSDEMRRFTDSSTGFDKEEWDWDEEFENVCADLGTDPANGIGFDAWSTLVDGEGSDSSYYFSDDLLTSVHRQLKTLQKKGTSSHQDRQEDDDTQWHIQNHHWDDYRSEGGHADVVEFSSGQGNDPEPQTRPEYVAAIFKLVDRDNDGFLNLVELRVFAEQTGFEGDNDEWKSEYALLCREASCDTANGVSFNSFEQLVNDQSDAGCYCADDELTEIHQKLSIMYPVPAEKKQTKARVVHQVGNTKTNEPDSKAKCKAKAKAKQPSQSNDWQEQWQAPKTKAKHAAYSEKLDDQWEDRTEKAKPVRDKAKEVSKSDRREEPKALLIAKTQAELKAKAPRARGDSREDLVEGIFEFCDVDHDGYLNAKELRVFAGFTGFEGTADEWYAEYTLLCEELACDLSQGMDFVSFATMVENDSDAGCYCTDEELVEIYGNLSESSTAAKTATDDQRQKQEQGWAAHPEEEQVRDDNGHLSQDDEEFWDNGGDNWEHSNQEWDDSHQEQVSQPEKSQLQQEQPYESPGKIHKPKKPCSRGELIQAIFHLCDIDKNGYLSNDELRMFAAKTGFEGSDDEWLKEYELLCQEVKCTGAKGPSFKAFSQMVDDDSDAGCYCTDDELKEVYESLAEIYGSGAEEFEPASTTFSSVNASTVQKAADPWAEKVEADPWQVPSKKGVADIDPWAAPAKKGASKHQGKGGKGGQTKEQQGKGGKGPEDADENAESTWQHYEAPKQRTGFDAQALLQASRAKLAARNAAKAEAASNAAPLRPATEVCDDDVEDDQHTRHNRERVATVAQALHEARALVQEIAQGSWTAAQELALVVMASPGPVHAMAVVSSALKALVQGRDQHVIAWLKVDELLRVPVDTDVAAVRALRELALQSDQLCAPLLVKSLPAIMVRCDDRDDKIRKEAEACADAIVNLLDPYATDVTVPTLLNCLAPQRGPHCKASALRLLAGLQRRGITEPLAQKLPEVIPAVSGLLLDVSSNVRSAAVDTMEVLFACTGNRDLEPHLENIMQCLQGKSSIAKGVRRLAEAVFVQVVRLPALAVVMPLVRRAFKERSEPTKREACLIVRNMCSLVPGPEEVQPFLPTLMPLLQRAREEISDPECRLVAVRAYQTLSELNEATASGVSKGDALKVLQEFLDDVDAGDEAIANYPAAVRDLVLDHVAMLSASMGRCRCLEESEWAERITPHLEPVLGTIQTDKAVERLLDMCRSAVQSESLEDDERDDENLLCDCTFTLGFGTMTLLSNTRLKLKLGATYGLCGPNNCGKSTLMRAIRDRKVEGFPPRSEVRSAIVEHGIGEHEPDCHWTPAEFVLADLEIQSLELSEAQVIDALRNFGFGPKRLKSPLSELSGGWKMKLGLVRAMLTAADLLLLDEPSGHLDKMHIKWLEEYIVGLRSQETDRPVTTIIVSHDYNFLERVCTHSMLIQCRKLRTVKGGPLQLPAHDRGSRPVKPVVEEPKPKQGSSASAASRAAATAIEPEKDECVGVFSLPEPAPLEGVRSRGRKIVRLQNVSYAYPNKGINVLHEVFVDCSMLSRVAIIGPNGAGKTTLARMVVGELSPDTGTAWRHPNLRIAYVAQHAFHHLEGHLEMTATEYILWRFQGSEDREAKEFKADEAITKEPRQYRIKDSLLVLCRTDDDFRNAVDPEAILGRRKDRFGGYEYDVKWRGKSIQDRTWVDRNKLADMGHLRLAQREDERLAAARGLINRPLTRPGVEQHLLGFGLDADYASHRRVGALSAGQKARVVLGAATWLAPHLLILDEPTNYLDGEGLTALSAGLRNFQGGVVLISHNASFAGDVADEIWEMEDGVLRREGGDNDIDAEGARISDRPKELIVQDEFGNSITVNKHQVQSEKERKRRKRQKELRRKRGEVVSDDDEDEWYDELLTKAGMANVKTIPDAAG